LNLNVADAALWALIAICLVLIGGLLTPGTVGIAERGTVLAGIVAVLFAIGWRMRKRKDDDG
jgi:hypothetical protein